MGINTNNDFNITDQEFFLLVLENVPEGTKITFDRTESESWFLELKPWSCPTKETQKEADYYTVDRNFVQKIKQLINKDPKGFYVIHHLSIYDDHTTYLDSLDNFTFTRLDVTFEKILRNKIKKR